jgi:hypothetical protein
VPARTSTSPRSWSAIGPLAAAAASWSVDSSGANQVACYDLIMTREDMTRDDYITLAGTEAAAMRYEDAVLSIGSEFLPPFARAVRDGAEGSEAYWAWLCEQWTGSRGNPGNV